jgi:hypothetical protein
VVNSSRPGASRPDGAIGLDRGIDAVVRMSGRAFHRRISAGIIRVCAEGGAL